MSTSTPHERRNRPSPANFQTLPYCDSCRTDAHLSYDDFVPAYYSGGQGLEPSTVRYTCKRCGNHYSHHAPQGWAPPGWQWYD
ncbi:MULTISPECIES: hypothetical protein [Arthrobacter]|uniref:Uncharacterized protein n=1 Tax=Arthrobacter terricola TaxID=2547396 RepID=A0A4R5KB23_9MICC|nr:MULTISPECIES: hypothetical protein [Arthrobacter]MBT8162665.1 hypothetical protein [Arthrobacter sp. GN70]TDF92443.1 hypothetical protein E1809_18050 [Arthrobacter terricola]